MIAYSPAHAQATIKSIIKGAFSFRPQYGNSLGERLIEAFKWVFEKGGSKAVIIGSDSPDLPADYINLSFEALDDNSVVLGPCTDGGYYLVGLKEEFPQMFTDIELGTDKVLNETLTTIRTEGKSLHLLPPWYDVDTPDELEFLKTHLTGLVLAGKDIICKETLKILEETNLADSR